MRREKKGAAFLRPHPEERGRRPRVSKDGGVVGSSRPMVRDARSRALLTMREWVWRMKEGAADD